MAKDIEYDATYKGTHVAVLRDLIEEYKDSAEGSVRNSAVDLKTVCWKTRATINRLNDTLTIAKDTPYDIPDPIGFVGELEKLTCQAHEIIDLAHEASKHYREYHTLRLLLESSSVDSVVPEEYDEKGEDDK